MNVGDLVRIVAEHPRFVSDVYVHNRIGCVIEVPESSTYAARVFDTYGSVWYYRINEVKKLSQFEINRFTSMPRFSRFLAGYAINGERAGERILM